MPIEVAISHSVSECQSDASGEFAIFCTKSVAMATSLDMSKKEVQIDHLHPKFDVKIAKIGPADLVIICLREIIKKGLKRKKLRRVKYIALPASLPSGLNKNSLRTV